MSAGEFGYIDREVLRALDPCYGKRSAERALAEIDRQAARIAALERAARDVCEAAALVKKERDYRNRGGRDDCCVDNGRSRQREYGAMERLYEAALRALLPEPGAKCGTCGGRGWFRLDGGGGLVVDVPCPRCGEEA